MSSMQIQNVLAEMRALQARTSGGAAEIASADAAPAGFRQL